jgi:hypothetical protein
MRSTRLALAIALLFLTIPMMAETITLLRDGNSLSFVDSSNPSLILGTVAVTGMQVGETLSGIDYRPSNGSLYGIASSNSGTTAQLYRIDTATGAATAIGPSFSMNASGAIGMDFNPVVDHLRIISNVGSNRRVNPDDGAVFVDNNAEYAPGDPNEGAGNPPWGLAYTNNFVGAPNTTLYGVTFGFTNVDLVTVGSVTGTPVSPNTGQMFTVGDTGINSGGNTRFGLDVSSNGTAYALLNSPVALYTINLANGTVTLIPGVLPSGVSDIAVGGPALAAEAVGAPALTPGMLGLLAAVLGIAAVFALRR